MRFFTRHKPLISTSPKIFAITLLGAAFSSAFAQFSYKELPYPASSVTKSSGAYAISANGKVIVGSASTSGANFQEAFKWDSVNGAVSLGFPATFTQTGAAAVSQDGSAIVGTAQSAAKEEAFYWKNNTFTLIPGLGAKSMGVGVSRDGKTVAGNMLYANSTEKGFLLDTTTSILETVSPLGNDPDLNILAVSGNGKTVVGSSGTVGTSAVPFYWTAGGGGQSIPVPNLFKNGFLTAVNNDGSILAGYFVEASGNNARAFTWTKMGGVKYVTANTYDLFEPNSMSDDGSVLSGLIVYGNKSLGAFSSPHGGVFDLANYIATYAGQYPQIEPKGVTPDGLTFVGVSNHANGYGSFLATIAMPPGVAKFETSQSSVVGGNPIMGTVTLTNTVAFSTNVSVGMYYDNFTGLLYSNIIVPAGQLKATGIVATPGISTQQTVPLGAQVCSSYLSQNLTLVPAKLTLVSSKPSIVGGNPLAGGVVLDGFAPKGGDLVTLSSNNAAATVPANVVIQAQTNSKTFLITTKGVAVATTVMLTATLNGVTQHSNLTINPALPNALTLLPSSVEGGTNSQGTVTLNGAAGPAGTVVQMSGTGPATLPLTVTVPAGKTSVSFPIATQAVQSDTTEKITATAGGQSASAVLTISA